MRPHPRKGNPVQFKLSASAAEDTSSIAGLRFDLDLPGGTIRIDLVAYRPRWLAVLFGNELRARAIGWRHSTARRYLKAIRRFLEFVEPQASELTVPLQLRAAHIDEFEASIVKTNCTRTARNMIQAVTFLLSGAAETNPSAFPTDLIERVRFVTERRPPAASKPRDSYSPYVRKQLRLAAKEDAWAAIERVGADDKSNWPKMSSRKRLAFDQWFAKCGVIPSGKYSHSFTGPTKRRRYIINGAYAFTIEDIAPMIVWVCLETGLEPECCISLQIDAVDPGNGKVARIKYFKARRPSARSMSILASDTNHRSVPALIRRVAELSQALRVHAGGEDLWLHISARGVRVPRISADVRLAVRDWALRRGIVGDDGTPLHLVLSRLRKTHRSARYHQVDGDLTKFAVNHSREVAADHYADIPSHRELHAGVVAQAQTEVVAAARLNGAAVRVAPHSPQGMEELWLASCDDINNPPAGPPRERCQVPFWGCLDCDNAVFSPAKLPALIEFRNRAVEARSLMTASDWTAKFGRAYRRVVENILPEFPQSDLEAAERRTSSIYVPYETFR